jgi:hypothetical protein
MSKMSLHDPFGYLKYMLWPKKGSGIKLSIFFLIIKSQKLPQFTCIQVASYISLESSRWELQLCFRPHLNRRSTQEVMGLKNRGSHNLGILGQNNIWVQASWPGTKNTIRGKVMVSPKSKPWWVLWVHVCLWFVRAPKMLQLCINQLVVWFV